jgi:hypothetical protein
VSRADLRLLVLAEHEEAIRAALANPQGVKRGGYYSGCTPDELAEKLRAVVSERRELTPAQGRQAVPAAPEGRARGSGRPAVPVQNRRKTLKLEKFLFGTAVAVVDVLAGTALPGVVKNLHKKGMTQAQAHAHLYGAIGVYALLALLTLWVIVSVVRGVSDSTPPPAPRPGYGSFGTRL